MAIHKATIEGKEVTYKYTIWRHIFRLFIQGDKIYCKWFIRLMRHVPTHFVYENGKLIETYTLSRLGVA